MGAECRMSKYAESRFHRDLPMVLNEELAFQPFSTQQSLASNESKGSSVIHAAENCPGLAFLKCSMLKRVNVTYACNLRAE